MFRYSFLAGLLLISIANLSMRSQSAPPIGSGPFCWPWQARDRYTPRGFVLHLAGCALWAFSAVESAIVLASG